MDNVTHALAGALLAAGTVSLVASRNPSRTDSASARARLFRRVAFVSGVVAAELPDADLLYSGEVLGMGKLGYMLHHRGHTHTVVFAILGALAIWLAGSWVLRRARNGSAEPATVRTERRALFALALLGTSSHIVLDWTNSYGVHPFWPVDNRWFYGDAVFIVEPWLWIVSIPPLLFFARSKGWRVVLLLLLLGIVGAAWRVDMVGRTMAAVLTAGAALWFALVRIVPAERRLTFALVAWLSVEGAFFTASARAREIVRASVGETYVDAVLTPEVSNPFCVRALAVERMSPSRYQSVRATVAPFAGTVPVGRCASATSGATSDARGGWVHASTDSIRWGDARTGDLQQLVDLATLNCEIAAALRFIRVPLWELRSDGAVAITDWRYGEGGSGFAGFVTSARARPCPRFVPPWIAPRADIVPLASLTGTPPTR